MKYIIRNSFCCLLILLLSGKIYTRESMKIIDRFSRENASGNEITGWEEKSFVSNTNYSIVALDGNAVLHARADSAASGLFKKIKYNLKEWPILSWRWKAVQLPEKGDVRFKETDDYGCLVYVVFQHI